MTLPDLSPSELTRYSRHLILPEVGMEGQKRLKAAKVLVVGAGGLGSPASLYLAAAGVGQIGLVDFDAVDVSNLQRQILHSTADVGTPKLESAKKRITALNSEISLRLINERLNASNVSEMISAYDVVVDGTDNFTTRYLVNDACVFARKPNVYGSIYRFEGQASVFCAPGGPCYRCLFAEPPSDEAIPNCAEGGVLGVLAGIIGVLQATEAIKWILELGDSLVGRLILYDALAMRFDTLKIARNESCPVCGDKPTITKLEETVVACAANTDEISVVDLNALMKVKKSPLLLDVRNQEEVDLCRLDGSMHIPLNELEKRIGELKKSDEMIVYCKSGGRSRRAIDVLKAQGFTKLRNLTGGIAAWAQQIDPKMPRY